MRLKAANFANLPNAEAASTSTPDLPAVRLTGPLVQPRAPESVAASANSKSTDHYACQSLPRPTELGVRHAPQPSPGDGAKLGSKITLNAQTGSNGSLPATETATEMQIDRASPSAGADAEDDAIMTFAAAQPSEDGAITDDGDGDGGDNQAMEATRASGHSRISPEERERHKQRMFEGLCERNVRRRQEEAFRTGGPPPLTLADQATFWTDDPAVRLRRMEPWEPDFRPNC